MKIGTGYATLTHRPNATTPHGTVTLFPLVTRGLMVNELNRIHALSSSFVPLDWKGRTDNESSTVLDIL